MWLTPPARGSHRAGRPRGLGRHFRDGRVRRCDHSCPDAGRAAAADRRRRALPADRPRDLDRRVLRLAHRRDAVAHARAADHRLPDRARHLLVPRPARRLRAQACGARVRDPDRLGLPAGAPRRAVPGPAARRRPRSAALEGPRLRRAAQRGRLRLGHRLDRPAGLRARQRHAPALVVGDARQRRLPVVHDRHLGGGGRRLRPRRRAAARRAADPAPARALAGPPRPLAARPLAGRPRRAADRDAGRRARRRRHRAAADRARPARRRPGAPGGAGDGPRHGRGALRPRPRERARAGRRGARGGQAGARRAARPRARDAAEPARRARPRPGHRRARRPQPGARHGDRRRPAQAAGGGRDRGLVRGLRGARQRRQAQPRRARRGAG